jgi:hypothetical protein
MHPDASALAALRDAISTGRAPRGWLYMAAERTATGGASISLIE